MKKILTSLVLLSLLYSCDNATFVPSGNDCAEIPTYDTNMKVIVDTYCSYSGCHDGQSGVQGDYTSYEGMKIHFDGAIMNRVIELRNMPPSYATGEIALSEEDYMLFNCWVSAEFPEN